MESDQMEDTEVQLFRIARSDGGTRAVAAVKPYFNGWFDVDLSYPGKYLIKVVNKQVEASCQLPTVTVSLDVHSPSEARYRTTQSRASLVLRCTPENLCPSVERARRRVRT